MARKAKKKTGKKKLSTYQRKTRRISRWRSFRRSLRQFFKRGYYAASVMVVVVSIGATWWWVHSGKLSVMVEGAKQAFLDQTADAGFALRSIHLSGHRHTSVEEVTLSLGLEAGDPIMGVSVSGIRERLTKLHWVKDVVVERQLPDALHIHLIERTPIAIWQSGKKFRLLDESGEVINEIDPKDPNYLKLILVVGEKAPEHIAQLLGMLNAELELAVQVKSATWVPNGRWDIRFDGGVEVKLPAQNAEKAWAMLAEMERQQHVLGRDISAVDLRLEGRVFIDLQEDTPESITRKAPSA